ncbi:uncharacterized protein AFUA_2G15350 [Aspergillus fumigatus Af293]|uniref:Uncharacterized protein n=2 Tax=Aspergillus fumigatus TaxID=746128 RepID=Q4WZY3_ASPFU|nr:hypothetical protein AFUA_2G15350 [Aspergillus fumigatus Af293]EAL93832.1 hypothetical protein AFUA_2G15350 [Aspergillus fumigatus Af293]EDP55040.1 hypothetical protein AFUB_031010 [Aspergillus fumigatus A1163]
MTFAMLLSKLSHEATGAFGSSQGRHAGAIKRDCAHAPYGDGVASILGRFNRVHHSPASNIHGTVSAPVQ